MYPHRIRLLGPWDYESIVAPGEPAATPGRITPPVRLHSIGLHGRLKLTRRFGYPGRIDPYEHVWLAFSEVADRADIALNDQPLGAELAASFEMEVTHLLEARNRLVVHLEAESSSAGLGEVALEVRRDAFL